MDSDMDFDFGSGVGDEIGVEFRDNADFLCDL
jgi:hypothetical protein